MDAQKTEAAIKSALSASGDSGLRRAICGAALHANPYTLAPLLIKVIMGEIPAEHYTQARDRLYQKLEANLGQ